MNEQDGKNITLKLKQAKKLKLVLGSFDSGTE